LHREAADKIDALLAYATPGSRQRSGRP
jgi:hypothetical protein